MRDEAIVRRRLGVSGERHRLNTRDSVDTLNMKPIKQVLSQAKRANQDGGGLRRGEDLDFFFFFSQAVLQ